jgi:hypothetical protein
MPNKAIPSSTIESVTSCSLTSNIAAKMRYTIVSLLALCLTTASAFRDTSPYILLSTSEYAWHSFQDDTKLIKDTRLPSTLTEFSSRQLQRQEDVVDASLLFLDTCPSDTYLIVSQPGVRASDLSRSKAVPHLRKMMSNNGVRTKFSVSEVSGLLHPDQLGRPITSKCGTLEMQLDPNRMLSLSRAFQIQNMLIPSQKSLIHPSKTSSNLW